MAVLQWSLGNREHSTGSWMSFAEDKNRVSRRHGAENLALVRCLALSSGSNIQTRKASPKRLQAASTPNSLLQSRLRLEPRRLNAWAVTILRMCCRFDLHERSFMDYLIYHHNAALAFELQTG